MIRIILQLKFAGKRYLFQCFFRKTFYY